MAELEWGQLIAMGAIVGLAGGYAGIGGAPFLVAGLALLLNFSQQDAQGTVLAVMLGPMSLLGVIVMWDRVRFLLPEIGIGVVAYALFSNVGARMAFAMETAWLEFCFGGLLAFLGTRYLRGRSQDAPKELNPTGPTIGGQGRIAFTRFNITLTSAGIGVVGGLFGIGAGVLMVPILIGLFAMHKDDARSLSLSILLPPVSIGAVAEYHVHDSIDWEAALVIFCLYFATNYFGAKLGRQHSTQTFLAVMGVLLGGLGLVIMWMSAPQLLS